MFAIGPLLRLVPMILIQFLPKILGALVSASPAIAGVSIMVVALAAGYEALSIARSALISASGAYGGKLWCALHACGAPQMLYWYIIGLGVALSFVVSDKVARATSAVASRIASSVTK